jgi:hypothetical protein
MAMARAVLGIVYIIISRQKMSINGVCPHFIHFIVHFIHPISVIHLKLIMWYYMLNLLFLLALALNVFVNTNIAFLDINVFRIIYSKRNTLSNIGFHLHDTHALSAL